MAGRTDKRTSVTSPSSCLLATSLADQPSRGEGTLPSAAQGEIKAQAQGGPAAVSAASAAAPVPQRHGSGPGESGVVAPAPLACAAVRRARGSLRGGVQRPPSAF